MNRYYICEKCGGNHPTEAHQGNMRDPKYLPSREEVLGALESQPKFVYEYKSELGFELLNKEYIEALGNYLAERLKAMGQSGGGTILEVGAGNGRLTHFLQEHIKKISDKIQVVGVSKSTGLHAYEPAFPVEDMDYAEALKKYQPQIVIASWMPLGEDWTADFRATPSVKEYILIGDAQGACGDEWSTWGNIPTAADFDETNYYLHAAPPFKEDGFQVNYLDDVEKFQISAQPQLGRNDTVSFKKT